MDPQIAIARFIFCTSRFLPGPGKRSDANTGTDSNVAVMGRSAYATFPGARKDDRHIRESFTIGFSQTKLPPPLHGGSSCLVPLFPFRESIGRSSSSISSPTPPSASGAHCRKRKDTADYFLASRSAGWFLIGSSIFASNIGAEHLIGLAGSGAGSGMAFAHWELHSWLVLVLGWIFAPFYLRTNVFTTPEFLERRYNPATRTLLSGIFLASYILTKASVTIFAGAFAIKTILGYETINLPLLRPDRTSSGSRAPFS
jgi:hypothetical protein